jgi:hypothetical protein
MHGVIRTETFLKDARAAGLSESDQQLIVVAISENPMLGDLMPGTGGCRKVRFAGKGKGKRGRLSDGALLRRKRCASGVACTD